MRRRVFALCMAAMMFSMTACSIEKEPAVYKEEQTRNPETVQVKAGVKSVENYKTLYRYLNRITKEQKPSVWEKLSDRFSGAKDVEYAVEETAIMEDSATNSMAAASETGDYGKTNVTTEGVDESDIIKNDGNYIYIYQPGDIKYYYDYIYNDYGEVTKDSSAEENEGLKAGIRIISVEHENMKQVGFLPIENPNYYNEFYLAGDQIIIVAYNSSNDQTEVNFYDITDRTAPKFVKSVGQEGGLLESRVQGAYVYLVTEKYNDYMEERKNEDCVPCVDGKKVASDCIYIPSHAKTKNFLTCSSIHITDKKVVDSVAVTDEGQHFYMSNESIYIASYNYEGNEEETEFMKIQVDNGQLTARAKKTLPGVLTDTFAINEYQDHLRLVMQRWDEDTTTTVLYVLDDEMNVTGKIKDIAPDEQIYSARFIGDTGYFVTFRAIDPLFSVDLSNPKNPKIIGELKIPGFSEYLHPYTDDLLLGIGYDVEDNHRDSIKLSMFDISDPSNVTEDDVRHMKTHQYASCMDAYKDLCIDGEKNIFGFSAQRCYEEGNYSVTNDYILASYDKEKGFQLKTVYSQEQDGDSNLRGTYVGDTFYTISLGHKMIATDLNTMEEIGTYEFS